MFRRESHRRKSSLSLLICLAAGMLTFAWANHSGAAQSIEEGLVVLLPFDEGEGQNATDASGNDNDARLRGGADWVQGQYGNAVDLINPAFNNRNPDWVEIQPDVSQNMTNQVTLAAWVRAADLTDGAGVITKGENITSYALRIMGDGRLMFTANFGEPFGWQGAGDWFSTRTIGINIWHHIGVTYDGATLRFYIDGVEDPNTQNLELVFGRASQPLFIGADFPDDNQFFDGAFDDVRVYNRALTPAEISAVAVPPNRFPILTVPPTLTTGEGQGVSVQVEAEDPEGEALTFEITGLPEGLGYDTATGNITGVVALGAAGNYTVEVSVSDEQNNTTRGTFGWVVEASTPTPTFTSTPTPTFTATPTLTPTFTPTSIATPTPVLTAVPTVTQAQTPGLTPTSPPVTTAPATTPEPTQTPLAPDGQQAEAEASQTFLVYQNNRGDNQISNGDILLFQTVISNTGPISIAQIEVSQLENAELTLVPNSIWFVKDENRSGEQLSNVELPVRVGPIAPSTSVSVVYQMKVQIDSANIEATIQSQAVLMLPDSDPFYAPLLAIPVARTPDASGQDGGQDPNSLYLPVIDY